MEKNERKKLFWNMASLGGLYMGAVLIAGILINYFLKNESGIITNISIIIAFVGIAFFYGKQYSKAYSIDGDIVTYSRALGFVVMMMVFAGILYGVTTFIMFNVGKEYYLEVYNNAMVEAGMAQETMDLMNASYEKFISSPILAIFSSIFSMILYGLFPALFIASFVRTRKH